jgi:hypothetical protein
MNYIQISILQVGNYASHNHLVLLMVQTFLVDAVEDAVDGLRVILGLFLIFIRQFLLGSSIHEKRMVGNHSEIESIVSQQVIEPTSFGLRPLARGIFVGADHMV